MTETQLLGVLSDQRGCEDFVVKPREELIIKDPETNITIYYCGFFERVKTEIHKSLPETATTEEFLSLLGVFCFLMF